LNSKLEKELIKLCDLPPNQYWKLIYKASNDGFEASSFHEKFDNKPNTLTLIKSAKSDTLKTKKEYIFGGYTAAKWKATLKNDKMAFIFSLTNPSNRPMKINVSQGYAFCPDKSFGPSFGAGFGNDIVICDKSNENKTSFSNFGCSYKHRDFIKGSEAAKNFLTGEYNFKVAEIEVFQKD
jgi:hypothetical protein